MSNARRGARAVGVAVGLAVGGILAGLVVAILTGVVLGALPFDLSVVAGYGVQFVAGGGAFVLVAVAYLRYRGLTLDYVGVDVPSLRDLVWAAVGYVSAFALVIVSGLVLQFFQATPDTANTAAQAGMEHPELLLWLVPLSLFVIAPAEELLYRGVIQSRLRETFKPVAAIPITAAVFAAVHFFSLTGGAGGRVIAISILFFPSVVFGVVYEKTENLVANVVVHGVYNSTLVLILYASMKIGAAPETATSFL